MPEISLARSPVYAVVLNDPGAQQVGDIVLDQAALATSADILTGLLDIKVTNNNYYQADTFSLLVAMAKTPPWFTLDYLTGSTVIPVSIYLGANDATFQKVFDGLVDDFEFDPVQNTLQLGGRDYTRFLIDTKTTEKWPNKTASAIALMIAARFNLVPQVTPTTVNVGSILDSYSVKTGEGRTLWDLLTWLAARTVDSEGNSFVTYVSGRVLYFGPRPKVPDYNIRCLPASATQPFQVLPALDGAGPPWGVKSMKFSRSLSTLRNIIVQVRSPQSSGPIALTASYPRGFKGIQPEQASTQRQLYQYVERADLTMDQLEQIAQAKQQDLARHEINLSLTLPGDHILGSNGMIALTGIDGFSQDYYVREVVRQMNNTDGYTMTVSAQNRAVQEETNL